MNELLEMNKNNLFRPLNQSMFVLDVGPYCICFLDILHTELHTRKAFTNTLGQPKINKLSTRDTSKNDPREVFLVVISCSHRTLSSESDQSLSIFGNTYVTVVNLLVCFGNTGI